MTHEFNGKARGMPATRAELDHRLRMRATPKLILAPSPGGTLAANVTRMVNEANERRIRALEHVFARDGDKLRKAFRAASPWQKTQKRSLKADFGAEA